MWVCHKIQICASAQTPGAALQTIFTQDYLLSICIALAELVS